MKISEKDLELVRILRARGALQDIEAHRLDQRKGVVLVSCADGDRFPDIFTHQARIQNGHRESPRVHTLSWNGGALRIARGSPLNGHDTIDAALLEEIAESCRLKGINLVVLYAHAPCAKAAAYRLGAEQLLEYLVDAAERVRRKIRGVEVVPFFHIDYGDRKQRSYLVNPKALG